MKYLQGLEEFRRSHKLSPTLVRAGCSEFRGTKVPIAGPRNSSASRWSWRLLWSQLSWRVRLPVMQRGGFRSRGEPGLGLQWRPSQPVQTCLRFQAALHSIAAGRIVLHRDAAVSKLLARVLLEHQNLPRRRRLLTPAGPAFGPHSLTPLRERRRTLEVMRAS